MWLKRMLKDRQELFVLGELALFLAAWGLGLAAAVDDYRDRTNASAQNTVAVNSGYSEGASSRPSLSGSDFSGQRRPEPLAPGQRRVFE